MIVSSKQLEEAAATIRRRKRPQRIRDTDIWATAAQMDTAASLLREAEPTVITSPLHMASTYERPGFIDSEDQDASGTLVLRIGILPSRRFRIGRRGGVVPQPENGAAVREAKEKEQSP